MNSIITYKQGEEARQNTVIENLLRILFDLNFELANRRNRPQRLQVKESINVGIFRVSDPDIFNTKVKA